MNVSQNYAVGIVCGKPTLSCMPLRICAAADNTRCTGVVLHGGPLGAWPRQRPCKCWFGRSRAIGPESCRVRQKSMGRFT